MYFSPPTSLSVHPDINMHCKARTQLPTLKKEDGVKSSLCFLIPINSVLFLPSLCGGDYCNRHMAWRQKLAHKARLLSSDGPCKEVLPSPVGVNLSVGSFQAFRNLGNSLGNSQLSPSTPTSWGRGETGERRSLQIGRRQFKRRGNWHRSLSWAAEDRSPHLTPGS